MLGKVLGNLGAPWVVGVKLSDTVFLLASPSPV
jgi:hypothetical protein